MSEEIKITVAGESPTITILHGTAEPVRYPIKFKDSGRLDAPRAFVEKRMPAELIDINKAMVIVDRQDNSIRFFSDPSIEYGSEITGTLKSNKDLLEFQINTEKRFTISDLIKFLRMRRIYFADMDAHSVLINKLANFSATITRDFQRNNDNRGNMKASIEQTAKTGMPSEFALSMPIFQGYEKKEFKVEIFLDARDAGIDFWFESVELAELQRAERDKLIDEELKAFSQFVIIER